MGGDKVRYIKVIGIILLVIGILKVDNYLGGLLINIISIFSFILGIASLVMTIIIHEQNEKRGQRERHLKERAEIWADKLELGKDGGKFRLILKQGVLKRLEVNYVLYNKGKKYSDRGIIHTGIEDEDIFTKGMLEIEIPKKYIEIIYKEALEYKNKGEWEETRDGTKAIWTGNREKRREFTSMYFEIRYTDVYNGGLYLATWNLDIAQLVKDVETGNEYFRTYFWKSYVYRVHNTKREYYKEIGYPIEYIGTNIPDEDIKEGEYYKVGYGYKEVYEDGYDVIGKFKRLFNLNTYTGED